MATKTDQAIPNQPSSSPLIRPPTPHPSYTHSQNPYDHRPLPLPPKYQTPVFQHLNHHRSTQPNHTCRRRILYSICILIFLIFTVTLISFLFIKPRPPKFTVERIKFNGFKNGVDPIVLSPNVNVQMTMFNPSEHMGVIYEADNSVTVRYAGARLGSGGFPTFYLAEKNSTLVDLHLAAVGLQFSSSDREAIAKEQKNEVVHLTMEIRAGIRFKAGSFKTRATALRAFCRLRVNDLVPEPVLISCKCKSSLGIWFMY